MPLQEITPEEDKAFYDLWPRDYWQRSGVGARVEQGAKLWFVRGYRVKQKTPSKAATFVKYFVDRTAFFYGGPPHPDGPIKSVKARGLAIEALAELEREGFLLKDAGPKPEDEHERQS